MWPLCMIRLKGCCSFWTKTKSDPLFLLQARIHFLAVCLTQTARQTSVCWLTTQQPSRTPAIGWPAVMHRAVNYATWAYPLCCSLQAVIRSIQTRRWRVWYASVRRSARFTKRSLPNWSPMPICVCPAKKIAMWIGTSTIRSHQVGFDFWFDNCNLID